MVAPPGFTFYDNTKVLPKIAEEVPSIKRFVIMDDIEHKYHLSGPLPRSATYEDYLAPYSSLDRAALPQTPVSPHDMVNVQFTYASLASNEQQVASSRKHEPCRLEARA